MVEIGNIEKFPNALMNIDLIVISIYVTMLISDIIFTTQLRIVNKSVYIR